MKAGRLAPVVVGNVDSGTEFRRIGEAIDREAISGDGVSRLCAATTICTAARRQLRG
jgi:hypothetical protein